MGEQILNFGITVLTAGITAFITYLVSIKTNLRHKEAELKRAQTFKYFLPLKFIAEELFHRLAHIEKKVVDREDIDIQLPQQLADKELGWYFTDWKDCEDNSMGAGGYFLVTTIFMQCQLYNRINALLKEYPFIEVNLKTSLVKTIKDLKGKDDQEHEVKNLAGQQLERCYNEATEDSHTSKWAKIEALSKKTGNIRLEKLTKCVQLTAVMRGGIPYALQTAFGQFIEKIQNGEIVQINYEEFARLLMDEEQRLKFQPIISFYSELVDANFKVDEKKLTKLRALLISLCLLQNAELD